MTGSSKEKNLMWFSYCVKPLAFYFSLSNASWFIPFRWGGFLLMFRNECAWACSRYWPAWFSLLSSETITL